MTRPCVLLLALSAAACDSMIGSDGTDPADPPIPSTPRPDLGPGDVVADGVVAAVVPPPGETVFAEALLDDGTARTLLLETDPDGQVWQLDSEALEPIADDEVATEATGACGDAAYTLLP
jgi:hypothetical protein